MKNIEKILGVALMVMAVLPACAQQYNDEKDFTAIPIDGGKGVSIKEYVGEKWIVNIPPKIQGLPVTHIEDDTFWGKSVVSITIPNSVTSITEGSFSHCYSLTAINVDAGNTAYSSIDGILYNKNKITLIVYPRGKTDVSFTIPNGVTSIDEYAFFGSSFTNVTIPSSVTSIGSSAFDKCDSLTSVTFQGTILSSGFDAYQDIGDLRDKFYATNSTNGTPGRYTTAAPVNENSVWIKQP
jgi:hypothetical protein